MQGAGDAISFKRVGFNLALYRTPQQKLKAEPIFPPALAEFILALQNTRSW